MVRKLREWYPGAMYHIMARGIRHMEIFSNDFDKEVFLTLLKMGLEKYNCTLHAYCLMSNHYHLLLETSDVEVWKLMKQLSHNYAMYFNKNHNFTGHLFENRYRSCLVEDTAYFLQTSRYIHLNPVKAKMCVKAEDYPWSSYRTMLGFGDDKLTHTDKTLKLFGDNAVMRYRDFVEDIAHKYVVDEDSIRTAMGEDELWLPW